MLVLNSETLATMYIQPVTTIRTQRRGRPRKVPNPHYLRYAMSPTRRISTICLAHLVGIHCNTLRAYLQHYNIDSSFSNVSNDDLDHIVRAYRLAKPEAGLRYLIGFLCSHGLRLQKRRVVSSVSRVDPLGQVLHARRAIQRRRYEVKCPNSLWHWDGHHKLIRWGIVLHGGADGYDRMVHFFVAYSLATEDFT